MARTTERDMKEIAHGCVKTALAKGASQAGARAYRVRDVAVQWRDGKLEQINESTTRGVGLQLYVDGRYSAVSTSDLRPDALDVFIADSVAMTRTLVEGPVPFPARAEAVRGPGRRGPEAGGPGLPDGHSRNAPAPGPRARGGGAGGCGQRCHPLRDHRLQRHPRRKCCGSTRTASRAAAWTRRSGPRPR